jgi:hypothetical protein
VLSCGESLAAMGCAASAAKAEGIAGPAGDACMLLPPLAAAAAGSGGRGDIAVLICCCCCRGWRRAAGDCCLCCCWACLCSGGPLKVLLLGVCCIGLCDRMADPPSPAAAAADCMACCCAGCCCCGGPMAPVNSGTGGSTPAATAA